MSSEKEQKELIDAFMAWAASPAALKEAVARNAARPAALTKEQKQKIDEAIAPLVASAMRTDRIDRDAAVAAFDAAYAALNLPPPEYLFCSSPAEAFQRLQHAIYSFDRFRETLGNESGLGSVDGTTPEIREARVNPKWRPAVKWANRPFDPIGALAGAVRSTLEESTTQMDQWDLLCYGNDSWWGNVARNGWLHALPALGIYQLPQDYTLACRALQTCGWVFTFERLCVISDRPESFHHPAISKEGPRDRIIVKWRDGFVCEQQTDSDLPYNEVYAVPESSVANLAVGANSAAYAEDDILGAMDDAQDNITWPDFEHLDYDIIGARLAAYRDDERWAIVFSTIQWNPASHDLIEVIAEPLGNCIEIPKGDELTVRMFDVVQVEIDPDDPALEERGSISEVRLRGKKIDLDKLELPEPEAGRDETFWLSAAIADKHRDKLLPSDKELARFFPDGMPPKFLELGEWHHAKWGVASEWEVFQLLAKAMVEGEPDLYRPTEKPNTHWRNWMDK